ncbi:hypothetical protein OCC_10589 [Thermococcus litoralis DSM 5473]|uniref:Uncharacterized protein n=1 Tax=Thermococcus litoralis (strain ATCC 51850 / DSM 5473 / JCM 8560 / NS-C) TaxID=523849 RepID=H3ZR76_THELN|nr:hypothetical protein [Thermococcus litoralis]EHR77545.1 hypothetical protein OCC_10589 [Thermococcus litoralis DSM 5473]
MDSPASSLYLDNVWDGNLPVLVKEVPIVWLIFQKVVLMYIKYVSTGSDSFLDACNDIFDFFYGGIGNEVSR